MEATDHPPVLTAPPAPDLPPDAHLRRQWHDEVHARPTARLALPTRVLQVAVLNEGVSVASELDHLRRLPGQQDLKPWPEDGQFLRLQWTGGTMKWERHTEVTRYSLAQPLLNPSPRAPSSVVHEPASLSMASSWFAGIPGQTLAAIELVMVTGDERDLASPERLARSWFGDEALVGSKVGRHGYGCVITDFKLRADGWERMLAIVVPDTDETRAGRLAARLLEVETYRLLALQGLSAAKSLQPMLRDAELAVADVTSSMEAQDRSDAELLESLAGVAARVERANAAHSWRFSATDAYDALVRARLLELREQPIAGMQTMGEFLQRRQAPAIATVASASKRLASLSQRIERAGALLRTRVDIAREAQNQELLAKLAHGQQVQLRMQRTVEGLSIAAISYYVVSLLLYIAKAASAAGLRINPELVVGLTIPLVVWGVWLLTQRIHARLQWHA